MDAGDRPVVNAAATSFEVLEAVRTLDEPGVSDIARHLDRSKSGVYKHVNTLTSLGYLARTGDSYVVGLGAWALGTDVADRFPMEEGARAVDSLAASTDHSVALVCYEGGTAYSAYQNCSPTVREQVGDVGDRLPLHATAAGKAILAYLPAKRRDDVLESRSLTRFTDRTFTDEDELRNHLETVRERRTAVELEERTDGITSIAAPITDDANLPIAAIAVAGTTDDLDGETLEGTMPSLVVNAARSVENAIARE